MVFKVTFSQVGIFHAPDEINDHRSSALRIHQIIQSRIEHIPGNLRFLAHVITLSYIVRYTAIYRNML